MPAKKKRRVLYALPEQEPTRLLSLDQRMDGSIYLSLPSFEDAVWVTIPDPHDRMWLKEVRGSEKLSFHGSGVSHIKAGKHGDAEIRLKGSLLADLNKREAGVRHLLTLFPSAPSTAEAPVARRTSDVIITTAKALPFAFILWAVPSSTAIQVQITASFDVEDLESVPPDSGFGFIPLLHHAVVWFAYRTKGMCRWPQRAHACFHDGHCVPVFVGKAEGDMGVSLRTPTFGVSEGVLSIRI